MSHSQQANAGWYCYWCRVMNGKHALHCHHCGGRWNVVGNSDQAAYDQWEQWQDQESYQHHQQHGQWPKSPKRKGKGKGKGKSPRRKHKNAEKADTPRQYGDDQGTIRRPPPAPPVQGTSWMQAAQQMSAPVAPSVAATPAPVSAIPAEYRSLIDTLKRNQSKGTLPEDVQQEMKSLKVKEEKEQTKEMHQAVKSLSKARRELREAYDARTQLHAQWRTFLSLSVSQWQEFTRQFESQEASAMRQIGEARAALAEAKSQFEDSKVTAVASGTGDDDVEVVSEEESNRADSSAMKLQDGLRHMTTSLQNLSDAAETIAAAEQIAKKPRLDGPEEATSTHGAAQLQPFAVPGVKRPTVGAGT